METVKKVKIMSGLLALFVTAPIWYFLMYSILEKIGASELTWFLFWVYVPISLFVIVVSRLFDTD